MGTPREGDGMTDAEWERLMRVRRQATDAADHIRDLQRLLPAEYEALQASENMLRRQAQLANVELQQEETR